MADDSSGQRQLSWWTVLSLALSMEADDVRRCVTCAEPGSKGRSSEPRAWQMIPPSLVMPMEADASMDAAEPGTANGGRCCETLCDLRRAWQ